MKKSILIIIIALILLTFMGLMLFVAMTYTQDDFSKSIRLLENEVTQERFIIDGLNLKPGDNREYKIEYSCTGGGNYDLSFDFNESALGGLEKYLVVEVESSSRKISMPLTDLFEDGNTVELTINLNDDNKETVFLRFIMPTEVGNEAQGTSTSFVVEMTAKHHSEEFGN